MTKVILGEKGQRPYRMPTETEVMLLTWQEADKVKQYLSVNSQYCDDIEIWLDSEAAELAEFFVQNPTKIPKRITVMSTVMAENRYKIEAAIRDKIYGVTPEIEYNANMIVTHPVTEPIQQTIGDFTTTKCSGCNWKIAHNTKHKATLVSYKEDREHEIHHLCEFCYAYVERIGVRPQEPKRESWCFGNDSGYANTAVRRAAKNLQEAISFLCYGCRGKGGWARLPKTHPIVKALKGLAETDKETCLYANVIHDEKLFEPILPDKKDCHP